MKRQVKLRRLIADGWRPDHMGTGTPPTPGEADCVRLKCFRLKPDGRVKRHADKHGLALWQAGGFAPRK